MVCPRDEMMPGTHSLNDGLLHEVNDWMQFDWENREDEQFVLNFESLVLHWTESCGTSCAQLGA